jgi:hypothetical protein
VMSFNWKFLVPLSIIVVLMQAFLMRVVSSLGLTPEPAGEFIASIPQTIILLLGNVVIGLVVLNMIRNRGRQQRIADEGEGTPTSDHGHTVGAPAGD